jgi:hypothetical protein
MKTFIKSLLGKPSPVSRASTCKRSSENSQARRCGLHSSGKARINGVWATSNLVVFHACIMPAGFGVGTHRMFIIDFQESSMAGAAPFRVQHFTSRWLNTKVSSGAIQKYIERLEANIAKHHLIKKLGNLHTGQYERRFQWELNKLDRQSRDFMLNAEKKCCRIKSGRIPFLPEAALWIGYSQVYQLLL